MNTNSKFPSVARSISVLERLMKMFYDQHLEKAGLTWGQMFPLEIIADKPGITPQDLASVLRVDRASVTRSIRKLTELGMVTSEQSAHDRRSYHLQTTPLAEEALEVIREAHAAFQSTATRDMSDEQESELDDLLHMMVNNLASCVTHRRDAGRLQ